MMLYERIVPRCYKCDTLMIYLRGIPKVNGLDVPDWRDFCDFHEYGCAQCNEFTIWSDALRHHWQLSRSNPPLSPAQWKLIGKRPASAEREVSHDELDAPAAAEDGG